jgi:hypothetical protein
MGVVIIQQAKKGLDHKEKYSKLDKYLCFAI